MILEGCIQGKGAYKGMAGAYKGRVHTREGCIQGKGAYKGRQVQTSNAGMGVGLNYIAIRIMSKGEGMVIL